jgi:hypothetical protein
MRGLDHRGEHAGAQGCGAVPPVDIGAVLVCTSGAVNTCSASLGAGGRTLPSLVDPPTDRSLAAHPGATQGFGAQSGIAAAELHLHSWVPTRGQP